jgi:cold shock CspA family protein
MATPLYFGVIVSWFETRNFGFIRPETPIPGCDIELFFHISDCPNAQPLPKNIRVQFEVGLFGGKKKAAKVRPDSTDIGLSAAQS